MAVSVFVCVRRRILPDTRVPRQQNSKQIQFFVIVSNFFVRNVNVILKIVREKRPGLRRVGIWRNFIYYTWWLLTLFTTY